jgi:hypothetical protein
VTKPRVHVLPRLGGGYRACAARVPGCVVIHQDPEFAAGLVRDVVIALIEDEQEKGETIND